MSKSPVVEAVIRQMPPTEDLIIKHSQHHNMDLSLFYLSSLCDEKRIHQYILSPFVKSESSEEYQLVLKVNGAQAVELAKTLTFPLFEGKVLIVTGNSLYYMSAENNLPEQSSELKTESTVLGPQKAFVEKMSTNLQLIRQRYPKPELNVEQFRIGEHSSTPVSLLYDTTLTDLKLLEKIRSKLQNIKIGVLQDGGQLERLINDRRYTLFPSMLITERPDRVVLNLSQGKIIVIIEGSPFALILPAIFFDFMSAMDDLYQTYWISRSLLLLRYIALFITITLPALYISIVSYNPEITRVQLTLSIAGSRAAVPYPSYVEVLIMLFMIEALVEASLRLPKFIGSTATTVGGLILGQAAQQAGLVSSIMIIITSAVAICNFVIPINAMSFAIRTVKYVFILFATMFGIVGTAIAFFLLLTYLTKLRSFGVPYLKLYKEEPRTARSGSASQAGDSG